MTVPAPLTFGSLLRYLRKQAGMTQGDLAAALGYSTSLISSLETGDRLPDLEAVRSRFVAALGLQDDPQWAFALIEQAALARGISFPTTLPLPRQDLPFAQRQDDNNIRLPALPTVLIGRTHEVNQLCNRLLGHAGRLLTLVGPPGVGKTTLALAVAAQIQHHYSDGACFIPLAAVSDAPQMASTILSAIAPDDAGPKPPQIRLLERLRRKNMLLILDNLEQIADAAPLIATMLSECPSLSILATSRERLHLRAEQRFNVPPLDLAPAVELFVQRAQAVDSRFLHTADNEQTLAAICTQLDCLPLALELCAAQVELFTLDQLLGQLRAHPLDLLVDGPHDLPPHQRTLRRTIQRSYALLPVDEQTFFRRLGVFAGGFDLAAAEAMGDGRLTMADSASSLCNLTSSISMIQSLIAKSLVRTEMLANGEQRFSLLETIREFALEQLQLAGEDEAARQRHYVIYLERFRAVDPHLRGPDAPAWFVRLQPEHDNRRAAIQWMMGQARYVDTAWLLVVTSWYACLRGDWYDEFDRLQSLLSHRHRFEPRLRLAFLIVLFSVARSAEELEAINGYADELIELTNECEDKAFSAGVWHFLAKAAPDFEQAARAWKRAIALGREARHASGLGKEFGIASDLLFTLGGALDYYATRLIEHGDFVEAVPLIQECLNVSEERGLHGGIAAGLGNWGLMALLQGDAAQAHTYLHEAVETTSTNVFPFVSAKLKTLLALVTLYQNKPTEARRLLTECLILWTNIRDNSFLSIVWIYLAETALWEGAYMEAEDALLHALAYRIEPHRLGSALVNELFVAARLAVVRLHHQQAAMLFGCAEETRQRAHYTLVAPVRTQVDAALAAVQAALDPVGFANAFAAGRHMRQAEAFAMLSSVLPSEVRQDIFRQQTQSLDVA